MLCLHAVSFPGQCGFLRHQEDVLQTNMKIDDREASVRGTRRHMPLWACKLRTACSRRRGPTSPRRGRGFPATRARLPRDRIISRRDIIQTSVRASFSRTRPNDRSLKRVSGCVSPRTRLRLFVTSSAMASASRRSARVASGLSWSPAERFWARNKASRCSGPSSLLAIFPWSRRKRVASAKSLERTRRAAKLMATRRVLSFAAPCMTNRLAYCSRMCMSASSRRPSGPRP